MRIALIIKTSLFALLCSISSLQSQEVSVEKSIFGIQTGFWGVWGYNELKLSPSWALRTEVGAFDYYGLVQGINLEPILTVEPRWYFNLNYRLAKGKRIDNNNGLFIALKTSFRPDFFNIPSDPFDNLVNPSIACIPYFAARKPIGKKLNYELGIGLGAEYFFKGYGGFADDNSYGESEIYWAVAFTIHLRIGLNL